MSFSFLLSWHSSPPPFFLTFQKRRWMDRHRVHNSLFCSESLENWGLFFYELFLLPTTIIPTQFSQKYFWSRKSIVCKSIMFQHISACFSMFRHDFMKILGDMFNQWKKKKSSVLLKYRTENKWNSLLFIVCKKKESNSTQKSIWLDRKWDMYTKFTVATRYKVSLISQPYLIR